MSDNYYYHGNTETIDIIKAKLSPAEFNGFCKGNILKYITRAGHKTPDPKQDYEKAAYYLDILIINC